MAKSHNLALKKGEGAASKTMRLRFFFPSFPHFHQFHQLMACHPEQRTPSAQTLEYLPKSETVNLSHREAEILRSLCRAHGEVVPMQNLLLDLWGDDDFFNARSLQVLITRLRRALSKDPRIRIVNVRGTGYKLIAE